MLLNTIEEPAPYRSVQHALRSAFAHEGHVICKSPMLFGSRMSASDLTPWDRAAQSAIVIRLLHENCRLPVIRAAMAQYMPGDIDHPRGTLTTKAAAIADCARHVATYPHLGGYPDAYLRDVVCLWADEPPSQDEPAWMADLGKSSRMLRNIKFGNSQRGRPGVCTLLDGLLDESRDVLGEVFSVRGLV